MFRLQIEEGTPYQYADGLFEVTEQQTADLLQLWADTGRFKEISRDEANILGYKELGEWSNPEEDLLFLIDDLVLVVQNKACLNAYNGNLNLGSYEKDS